MCQHECNCSHPEKLTGKSGECTLNQVIECHGDQSFKEILEWFNKDKK